jgi:hypothetical protein
MSVTVSSPSREHRRAPARESLGDTIALARARSLENRRCGRRVRQEARDALAVVLFSAAASTAVAVVLTLVLAQAG